MAAQSFLYIKHINTQSVIDTVYNAQEYFGIPNSQNSY